MYSESILKIQEEIVSAKIFLSKSSSLDDTEKFCRQWETTIKHWLDQIIQDSKEVNKLLYKGPQRMMTQHDSLNTKREVLEKALKYQIDGIEKKLKLLSESNSQGILKKDPKLEINKRVLIIHGHNESLKEKVARTITSLGLESVILHEQLNQGKTILEKLENCNVGYVVALLTADDRGGTAKQEYKDQQLRARQNVIFEFGLFAGKLGREKTSVLLGDGVEKPSDIDGLVYIKLEGESWKLILGKELKSVYTDINLDKIPT